MFLIFSTYGCIIVTTIDYFFLSFSSLLVIGIKDEVCHPFGALVCPRLCALKFKKVFPLISQNLFALICVNTLHACVYCAINTKCYGW